ncbi:hypothetical protein C7B77_05105 [Chamaesiphon polymorphus CCALA 037]|uniref:Uncharacterized protein n=1 Tax=Chamaesiphon polymorphus CCALA 037 TaxID=2107692 RepID=A0A2T1GKG7_9CYAN|nr:hypothetical protein C7B77_05105 [Chamaesiphon polymorphus CCALA 037]
MRALEVSSACVWVKTEQSETQQPRPKFLLGTRLGRETPNPTLIIEAEQKECERLNLTHSELGCNLN